MEKNYSYDVFLSFRGEDTRKKFVDHLYTALVQQGIHTFRDDEGLEKGKQIKDKLFKSIEESRFYIIVFSMNYASSSWCLDELAKIMECQKTTEQVAYPVFYDVEPTEVREQIGQFGDAFAKHDGDEVGKWREALEEASNLAGWDLRNTADGHEAKLIKRIVEQISLELRSINLSIDENLIGMDSRVKEVESFLEIGSDDVRMIGIKGIGGGGKTTLAGAIFDKLSFHFEGRSFVENVREASKAFGVPFLQKQVLSDVLNDQGINVQGVHDGRNKMKTKLRGKRVFLVLDDVDHINQLEALAGASNWFDPGSRIIITTRDEQVLVAHKVKFILDVKLLSDEEAIHLFSKYAFGANTLIQGCDNLSLQVVRYAAGLPLTIKVLGSFLCGKDKLEWIDALKRLETIPLKETLEILELSYTGLEDDYKEIFLDVACFMKGSLKENAIRILESCEFHAKIGLKVLEQKSLITISNQRLGMHDHIHEMGMNIVRRLHPDEPHQHSRLWIRGEVEDILANDLGTEVTTTIMIDNLLQLGPEIATNGFGKMKKLRFLHIGRKLNDPFRYGLHHDENVRLVTENIPDALRYLCWDYYPEQSLPQTFRADNLVALEMCGSQIVQLWEGGKRKVLNKLRFLDLTHSRLRILDLEMAPNLERLNLVNCCDLVELRAPVGYLKRLSYLNLSHCWRFESSSFIKHLESLEVLYLEGVCRIELSDIIPGHSNSRLRVLWCGYEDMEELPSSIGNLQNLDNLIVGSCEKLKSLPESLCGLRHLRTLVVTRCIIEELPEDLGRLECLETLTLSSTRIKHLPESICLLKHLKSLYLSHCYHLEKLPVDLGLLERLEELRLVLCKQIRDIPDNIISKSTFLLQFPFNTINCPFVPIYPTPLYKPAIRLLPPPPLTPFTPNRTPPIILSRPIGDMSGNGDKQAIDRFARTFRRRYNKFASSMQQHAALTQETNSPPQEQQQDPENDNRQAPRTTPITATPIQSLLPHQWPPTEAGDDEDIVEIPLLEGIARELGLEWGATETWTLAVLEMHQRRARVREAKEAARMARADRDSGGSGEGGNRSKTGPRGRDSDS